MWSLSGFINDIKFIVSHPRFTNLEINTSGIILILVVIGVFSAAFFANIGDHSDALKDKVNAAIGSSSGVVHRKDDPPIPPPSVITALRIYPIKSCRGFEISSTRLKRAGLTLDRNWMFISQEDKKFLTIRGDPSMTLIDTAIVEQDGQQMLEVSIHGTDGRVTVPAFPSREWLESNTSLETVEIWEKETDGWVYNEAINKMFSDFFNKPVALVYKGPTHRMVAINGRKELYGEDVPHHFADVMSLQVASEASMKDLNKQLGHAHGSPDALTIERFRPNIIIKGRDDHPWEEDTWKRIRISTNLPNEEALYKLDLDVVARCARCQVPNVDPDTAQKNKKEPWDTLMKSRRVDTGGPAKYKPCFGMMAIPKNEGKIAVGGTLEVLETTDKHWYNERAFGDL
ncbi:hypothetical protein DOTSEDRAFT_43137 [Dothistroma septosporum NZE10]|uniref:MOSC domain-containing protein n=1 Tax=Dothistroma septosporum (strain NZE10 / CBS 128990) TaxID=675120 RepID=N1PWC5_DOTSN|nr:hypothetical protein DOTSEDRAFT_43137 [Dothistroma septosporum NZE10]